MKRVLAMILGVLILCSLSVAAFADEGEKLIMKMDRNGRTIYYEDGTKAPYSLLQRVEKRFHWLRHSHGVNWDLFTYEEMEFSMDSNGKLTALSQYLIGNDGKKIESSDPKVVFLDSPTKFHASGAGTAQVKVYDEKGALLSTSNIEVTGASFSTYILVNRCGKCGEDQGMELHLMSCGHFSCDVGRAGHGDAPCGVSGHFNCSEGDHSICSNCQKPMCNGKEHGWGICPHVHAWAHGAWDLVPTCTTTGVERVYCPGCGAAAIVQVPPVDHCYSGKGICFYCYQSAY